MFALKLDKVNVDSDTKKRKQANYYDIFNILFFKVIVFLIAEFENHQTFFIFLKYIYMVTLQQNHPKIVKK